MVMKTMEEELKELTSEQYWTFNFRLPNGVTTKAPSEVVDWRYALNRRVLNSIDLKGKRVLDMGCSDGFYSCYLAEMGAEVLGVDIDERRIRKADFIRRHLGLKNIRFECGNVLDADFRKSLPKFDAAFAWGFLHRVADPFNALGAMAEKADVLALEWEAPALPLLMNMSMAIHPGGGQFEWQGMHGKCPADYEENAAGRQANRIAFWNMTPGAIRTMVSRFGFHQACYVHDPLPTSYWLRVLSIMLRNRLKKDEYKSWLKLIRVHGIFEREGKSIMKTGTISDEPLPAAPWDAVNYPDKEAAVK